MGEWQKWFTPTLWDDLVAKGQTKSYKQGDIVYMQGTVNIGLVFLIKGELRNCVFFSDGTDITIYHLRAPDITAETSMVDQQECLTSVVALTDATVSIVPEAVARDFLLEHPDAMMAVLQIMARKMRATLAQSENVVMSIRQKLARFLLRYAKTYDEHYRFIHLTHEQIASYLGATRPKITKELNHFENEGYIRITRGEIEILDYESLQHEMKIR